MKAAREACEYMENGDSPALIDALKNPDLYDHPVTHLEVVETHISWVILTGPYAYKIKKPVDFGFLDYSTLEKRRIFCEKELRLNRRQAPGIYLGVTAITGSPASPRIGGEGPAIEYAVRMVEFPQENLLDRVMQRGGLSSENVETIADEVALFHKAIDAAGPNTPFGTPESARHPVEQNFAQVEKRLEDKEDLARIESLKAWARAEGERLHNVFAARKGDGYVRECHGDMHLGNMFMLDGRIVIFDCIEFNDYLRWIDVISETAFLVMDLEDRGRGDFAALALNRYLERTGDYGSLRLARYYKSYRAMVRAKVACLRLSQPSLKGQDRSRERKKFLGYVSLAEGYTRAPRPALVITHGVAGSGKTTSTRDLLMKTGAIRVRSDIERKRLFGLEAEERSGSGIGAGMYAPEATRKTYDRLARLAETVIGAGYAVIVDATFLKRADRQAFRALARRLGVPFAILDFRTGEKTVMERVARREAEGQDASEATVAVLLKQIEDREELTDDERARAITVNTDEPVDTGLLRGALEKRKLPV